MPGRIGDADWTPERRRGQADPYAFKVGSGLNLKHRNETNRIRKYV